MSCSLTQTRYLVTPLENEKMCQSIPRYLLFKLVLDAVELCKALEDVPILLTLQKGECNRAIFKVRDAHAPLYLRLEDACKVRVGYFVREWQKVEVVSVHDDGLVAETLIDPAIVHNVPLLFILHTLVFCLPDAGENAVLLHDVVRLLVFVYDFPTVLNNPPAKTLHKVKSFSALNKGVGKDGKGVPSKNIGLYPIL